MSQRASLIKIPVCLIGRPDGGCGVSGGDRAVVDDATITWRLVAHHAERGIGTQEQAMQVDGDHLAPLFPGHIAKLGGRHVATGVVEQHIEASEPRMDGLGQGLNRRWLSHVGLYHQQLAAPAGGGGSRDDGDLACHTFPLLDSSRRSSRLLTFWKSSMLLTSERRNQNQLPVSMLE